MYRSASGAVCCGDATANKMEGKKRVDYSVKFEAVFGFVLLKEYICTVNKRAA